MKISAKAEYACLAMAELAARHQRRMPTSLKVIADTHRISQAFLMQIFMQLKGARLVQAVRGSTGGYQLSRPPESIHLLEIVNAIDGPAGETSALDALPPAPLLRSLQSVWKNKQRAEQRVLEDVTLADIARRGSETALEFQI